MTDSHAAELNDLIDRTFIDVLGGRATATMVHQEIMSALPDHVIEYLIGKGLGRQIGQYFRRRSDDGLPHAPEVNPEGEHVQLELLDEAEYAYLYRSYMQRSEENVKKAELVRRRCMKRLGVDVAATLGQTAASVRAGAR